MFAELLFLNAFKSIPSRHRMQGKIERVQKMGSAIRDAGGDRVGRQQFAARSVERMSRCVVKCRLLRAPSILGTTLREMELPADSPADVGRDVVKRGDRATVGTSCVCCGGGPAACNFLTVPYEQPNALASRSQPRRRRRSSSSNGKAPSTEPRRAAAPSGRRISSSEKRCTAWARAARVQSFRRLDLLRSRLEPGDSILFL